MKHLLTALALFALTGCASLSGPTVRVTPEGAVELRGDMGIVATGDLGNTQGGGGLFGGGGNRSTVVRQQSTLEDSEVSITGPSGQTVTLSNVTLNRTAPLATLGRTITSGISSTMWGLFGLRSVDAIESIQLEREATTLGTVRSNNSAMTAETLSDNATAVQINDSNNALEAALAP